MGATTTIEVDGNLYKAKFIGKGSYSRVYRVGDRVIYYTKDDCAKEVMAMYIRDRMTHLPEIIRHDDVITTRGLRRVFSSPYYRDVSRKDGSAWKLYNHINTYFLIQGAFYYSQGLRGLQHMEACVAGMEEAGLPKSVIRAFDELINVASNCSYPSFDIHKENFGVNDYGTLIFRDVIQTR